MHKKAMEKATAYVITETCYKEREENKVKKFATHFIVDEQTFEQCAITKSARTNFEFNWFKKIIK